MYWLILFTGSSVETLCSPPRIRGSLRFTAWMFSQAFTSSQSMEANMHKETRLSV